MPNTGRQGGLKLGPRPDDRVLFRSFGRNTPMIGPTTVNSGVRSLRLRKARGSLRSLRGPCARGFGAGGVAPGHHHMKTSRRFTS